MKKIAFIIHLSVSLLCFPAFADDCPRPKVGVKGEIQEYDNEKTSVFEKLNKDNDTNKPDEEWTREIHQLFLSELRNNNPDVDFVDGSQDVDYLFSYLVNIKHDPDPDMENWDPNDWYRGCVRLRARKGPPGFIPRR